MATTGQSAVNLMRVHLGETDVNNSRWDDDFAQLLPYYNYGRREFAKETELIKALFEQTTVQGATLGNRYARYVLPPELFKIDEIYWDDTEVERGRGNEWEEQLQGILPDTEGRPYIYRLFGDAIDLYFAPDKEALLEIYASVFTQDLPTLAAFDTELNDDQSQAAVFKAVSQALTDDDRDGSLYESRFLRIVGQWRKARLKQGPRYVEQTFSRKHRRL